jgi:hypothetical protein
MTGRRPVPPAGGPSHQPAARPTKAAPPQTFDRRRSSVGQRADGSRKGAPDNDPVTLSGSRSTSNGQDPAPAANPAPAPPVDPDSFSPATVRKAETLLKKLGFSPGKVDSTYTGRTEEAVKSF